MSIWAIPLSPWWARDRKAVAREKRRASHGPWLARSRSTSSHWARGPEYAVAWEEALRRLPSLARLDNAGEFGRDVLRTMLNRAMFMRWSRNPRARRWLQRMRAAGIVECHESAPASRASNRVTLHGHGAPWCLAEELRLLIPEEVR